MRLSTVSHRLLEQSCCFSPCRGQFRVDLRLNSTPFHRLAISHRDLCIRNFSHNSILSQNQKPSDVETQDIGKTQQTLDRKFNSTARDGNAEEGFPARIEQPSISQAILYFLGFSAVALGAAAYTSLKETSELAKQFQDRSVLQKLADRFNPNFRATVFETDPIAEHAWGPNVTYPGLITLKRFESAKEAHDVLTWMRDAGVPAPITATFQSLANYVLNIRLTQQMVMPIILVNGVVYLMWARGAAKNTKLFQFLWTNFLHRPSSRMSHTMLTSTFSHSEFWHFAVNNFALWTFGGGAFMVALHQHRSKEDIPVASDVAHFLAFFAMAGVFAAATSHIANAIRFSRITRTLGFEQAAKTVGRSASLGSSGAIWSVVMMTACVMPDTGISLIFLPFFSFPIKYGVVGMVGLDLIGVIRGWKLFDHVAHLGGAFFGLLYYQYGIQVWVFVKDRVAKIIQVGPYDPVRRQTVSTT